MLNREQGPGRVGATRAVRPRSLPTRSAVAARGATHPAPDPGYGRAAAVRWPGRSGARVIGIETMEGRRFGARAVVVTSGTFGVDAFISDATGRSAAGGPARRRRRIWPSSSTHSDSRSARFKTGTPPTHRRPLGRLTARSAAGQRDRRTSTTPGRTSGPHRVDAERFDAAPGAAPVLDHLSRARTASRSSPTTLASRRCTAGAIGSRGPRYCPSVEDKIVKFPTAERHQIFLEPEGHDTLELYVNGLSTSLPAPYSCRHCARCPDWSTCG